MPHQTPPNDELQDNQHRQYDMTSEYVYSLLVHADQCTINSMLYVPAMCFVHRLWLRDENRNIESRKNFFWPKCLLFVLLLWHTLAKPVPSLSSYFVP